MIASTPVSLSGRRLRHECPNSAFVDDVAAFDVLFPTSDSCDGLRVCEQLEGRFQGFEIFGGEQDDVFASVPSDLDAIVCGCDFLGNLRQSGFDLGQRHALLRPEL